MIKQLNLRVIALFKVIRGCAALSLAVGFGLGSVEDLQALELLPTWLRAITDDQLLDFVVLFFTLALIRFSEALGLWFQKTWAQWLAVVTGFVAIGFFTHKLWDRGDPITVAILIINVMIVTYLLWSLSSRRN